MEKASTWSSEHSRLYYFTLADMFGCFYGTNVIGKGRKIDLSLMIQYSNRIIAGVSSLDIQKCLEC